MDSKPRLSLVADYVSDSEEESVSETESVDSVDSEPDSSSDFSFDSSDEVSNIDEVLEQVEELKITVSEEETVEFGKIKFLVEHQVIIEPKSGVAALDLNSVLFLDKGKLPLGRIADVIGPVNEPNYIVLFNSSSDIHTKGVKQGMTVYYAPKTDHTSFVPVSDLMRLKGSDASWAHNEETPAEFQDFSDDDAEKESRGHLVATPNSYWNVRPVFPKRNRTPNRSQLPRQPSHSPSPKRNQLGQQQHQRQCNQWAPQTIPNLPMFPPQMIMPPNMQPQFLPPSQHPPPVAPYMTPPSPVLMNISPFSVPPPPIHMPPPNMQYVFNTPPPPPPRFPNNVSTEPPPFQNGIGPYVPKR